MSKTKRIAAIVSCFDWYSQRLMYIEKYLVRKGYDVYIYMSDYDHQRKVRTQRYSEKKNVEYIHVPEYKRNISLKRIVSHRFFAKKVVKKLSSFDCELVYCLVPPNFLVSEIAKINRIKKFRLIFDVIDLWPESFPITNSGIFPFSMWGNLRDKNLYIADDIVLECRYYKTILKKQLSGIDNVHVFPLIKQPINNIVIKTYDDGKLYLAYLGSINSLIDIETTDRVIRSVMKINPVVVKIIGDGESKREFIDMIQQTGAEVEYYGKIYDDRKKYEILGQCHFGLNLYKTSTVIGLTMKSVDYFQMGLPIINSISGDTKELVNEYNIGINVECIEEKIREYLKDITLNKQKVLDVFYKNFSAESVDNRLRFLDDN